MKRFCAIVLLLLAGCSGAGQQATPAGVAATPAATMTVSSTVFAEGAAIPRKYTCDAENVSPPLAWSRGPAVAQSLGLIADDPDAPAGTWTHWVVFNLPPATTSLSEGWQPQGEARAIEGTTSFGKAGYGGPCPPSGTHHYYFRLYALDTSLDLSNKATAAEVRSAMQGHVLAEGSLMGRYGR